MGKYKNFNDRYNLIKLKINNKYKEVKKNRLEAVLDEAIASNSSLDALCVPFQFKKNCEEIYGNFYLKLRKEITYTEGLEYDLRVKNKNSNDDKKSKLITVKSYSFSWSELIENAVEVYDYFISVGVYEDSISFILDSDGIIIEVDSVALGVLPYQYLDLIYLNIAEIMLFKLVLFKLVGTRIKKIAPMLLDSIYTQISHPIRLTNTPYPNSGIKFTVPFSIKELFTAYQLIDMDKESAKRKGTKVIAFLNSLRKEPRKNNKTEWKGKDTNSNKWFRNIVKECLELDLSVKEREIISDYYQLVKVKSGRKRKEIKGAEPKEIKKKKTAKKEKISKEERKFRRYCDRNNFKKEKVIQAYISIIRFENEEDVQAGSKVKVFYGNLAAIIDPNYNKSDDKYKDKIEKQIERGLKFLKKFGFIEMVRKDKNPDEIITLKIGRSELKHKDFEPHKSNKAEIIRILPYPKITWAMKANQSRKQYNQD